MPIALVRDASTLPDGLPVWKRDLLRRLAGLQQDTSRLLAEALELGNIALALQAMQRAEKQLWLEWQICEEQARPGAVNVAVGVIATESPVSTIMARLDQMNRRRVLASVPYESPER